MAQSESPVLDIPQDEPYGRDGHDGHDGHDGQFASVEPVSVRQPRTINPTVVLFVILTAQMMVVLDATIVNVALPRIQASLHFSSSSLSWVLNAYILTFGGLLLLGARAGDLLGRKRTFMSGIALFTLSSLSGGFATSGWMLLSARALQGIGGALAAPAALALLTTIFPEGRARIRAIALFTTVSAAGGATGLVAGGLLTEWATWRWVMFVNVPIGIAVVLIGRLVLVETPRRTGHFDLAGAITSILGMTGAVFGLVEAGNDGWSAPITLISLIGGLALLGWFVSIERRAEEPILPLRLVTHPGRMAANLARGLVYAGMYGMFFFLTQYLQDVDHYSPIRAGLAFLPIPTSVFLFSQLTSRVLVDRIQPKLLMLSGISLSLISLILTSRLHAGASYPQILLSLVLLGAGSGISFVSLTTASLADVEPADAGAASGLVNVSQQIGAALGLAVLVTVFDTATHHARMLGSNASSVAQVMHGMDTAFAVGAGFALVALALVGIVIRSPRTDAVGQYVAREIAAGAIE